jgi:hypothetical protein
MIQKIDSSMSYAFYLFNFSRFAKTNCSIFNRCLLNLNLTKIELITNNTEISRKSEIVIHSSQIQN